MDINVFGKGLKQRRGFVQIKALCEMFNKLCEMFNKSWKKRDTYFPKEGALKTF